mmetsp:Transcript_28904/g.65379  ORF Transcript_28904/g.65379 Transcript_28904/m.65379 type:complete len:312 (+) Transcript_28904:108-1043(+)
MVGMSMTFGTADYSTPHGGPPFHYWKKGYGFGHSRGPGKHVQHPAMPERLRFTPSGDRGLSSSSFWRGKYEVGQASSFGIGDRPDLNPSGKDGVAPNNYGDVSKQLNSSKRNMTRSGITVKKRFPSMEEKYRDQSWPKAGPGPAKYNLCNEAGKSSWSYPSPMPSWTCQPRGIVMGNIKETMSKPGPTEYDTRSEPGKNYPSRRGTLHNISMRGKSVPKDSAGDASPGPARYLTKGLGGTMPLHGQPLDHYGLWQKIANVKVPKDQPTDERSKASSRGGSPGPDEDSHGVTWGGEAGSPMHTLNRVESSPL